LGESIEFLKEVFGIYMMCLKVVKS